MKDRYSFRTARLSYTSPEDLQRQLNRLLAREIISVTPTTPKATDGNTWVTVYYSYDT